VRLIFCRKSWVQPPAEEETELNLASLPSDVIRHIIRQEVESVDRRRLRLPIYRKDSPREYSRSDSCELMEEEEERRE
ncbi:hypothetical protein PMAYCL1PPCAC_03712, partial [Pristionchus mayeri]